MYMYTFHGQAGTLLEYLLADDARDGLEQARQLAKEIRRNPQAMAKAIEEKIREEALELDLCPKCFEPTRYLEMVANVSEHFGNLAAEPEMLKECPACGWREE